MKKIDQLPRGALEHLAKFFGFRREMLPHATDKQLAEFISDSI